MSVVVAKTEITPEELLAMPDEKNYELVGGELVEKNVSALSCWVALETGYLLRKHLEDHPSGLLFGADNGYQCYADEPRKVRKADVSFIKQERIPANWQQDGYLHVAPDLAVEVVSPNDLASEVNKKVHEYLKAGVSLVWVVDPETRLVYVHHPNLTGTCFTENDELSGEDVLPGFRCPVRSLFPPPVAVAP